MTSGIHRKVERVADGFRFVEGPVWVDRGTARRNGLGDGAGLFFSDIEADTQYFLCDGDISVVRSPSGAANGNAIDRTGRLLSCEHSGRRVARRDDDGVWTTLVDRVGERRLNSPNDVCVRADGTVFFTDPPYGIDPGESELDLNGVYRLDLDGQLHLVDGSLARPNGVAIDPDGRSLWVADTESGTLVRYGFTADNRLNHRTETTGFDRPDGLAFDTAGRLLVAAMSGIVVQPTGGGSPDLISLPERPANLCFGGSAGREIWICARTSIRRILDWPVPGLPLVTT